MFAVRKCLSANVGLAFRTGRSSTSKYEGQFLLGEYQFSKVALNRNLNSRRTDDTKKLATLAHQTFTHPQHDVAEEKSPIIILHGLLGSKSNWGSMAKALLTKTQGRRVITVDLRNHGDSTHSEEFTYELMASDVVKFLYDQNIKNATLIGHSLGGRVCMLVAMMYPMLVDNLIVVDISPIGQSPNMLGLVKIFEAIKNLNLDPSLSVAKARSVAVPQLKEILKDDDLVLFILMNLAASQGKSSWRWKFNLDSIMKNFLSEICRFPVLQGKYNKPTLFIAGEKSDYIKVDQESMIEEIFPSAQFVYIPGAGHWVHAEKPHEFLSVVSNFIDSKDAQ